MRVAVLQLPSDEEANIDRTWLGHVEDVPSELLPQQLRDDAAAVAARACRQAAHVSRVVVVPTQFVGDGVGGSCR